MNNDLISRAELLKIYNVWLPQLTRPEDAGDRRGVETCIAVLQDAPAVDAEPVRHGRWLPTNDDNKKRCSECDVIHLIAQYPHGQANYCPNCGAKMDGQNAPVRKCATCQHDGWDMPQCRECNEKNGFKWFEDVRRQRR